MARERERCGGPSALTGRGKVTARCLPRLAHTARSPATHAGHGTRRLTPCADGFDSHTPHAPRPTLGSLSTASAGDTHRNRYRYRYRNRATMTYPQYGPPQGQQPQPQYPPQYPPAGVPQPGPMTPQGYGQAAPAAQPQGFSAPPPAGQSYPRPKIADLVGRLLLIRPTAFDRGVPAPQRPKPGEEQKLQDRITADIDLLDGGPVAFGGSVQQGRPNTHQDPPGTRFKGVFLSQVGIVAQLQGYLPSPTNPTGGRCLARVGMGTSSQPGHNRPYRLEDPTEADIALANQYLAGEQAGALPLRSSAEPIPGQQPPAAPAGPQYAPGMQGQYVPQQQPAMAGPPPGYPPMGQPPQQPSYAPPGYPQQQPQPGPGQFPQYPPQQPGPAGYLASPDPGAQYAPPPQQGQQPQQAATPWG